MGMEKHVEMPAETGKFFDLHQGQFFAEKRRSGRSFHRAGCWEIHRKCEMSSHGWLPKANYPQKKVPSLVNEDHLWSYYILCHFP